MKTITKEEYVAAVHEEVTEVFEMMCGQDTYIEVVQGEEKIVGIVYDLVRGEFFGMTCLFAKSKNDKFAIDEAVAAGRVQKTCFEYTGLGDAQRHMLQLMKKSLGASEESDANRTARFETIKDLLEESDMADIKLARELMDAEAAAVEDKDPKRTEEIECAAFTLDCIIEPDIYAV